MEGHNGMISVIIPVYNVEAYLPECIDSVLSQDYTHTQVILVDDGSTDGSGRICDRYGEEYSNVVVIHKKNGGLSSARNEGLLHVTGDYISFIDSDDYIEQNTFSVMMEIINKKSADVACMARFLDYENGVSRKVNCLDNPQTYSRNEYVAAVLKDKNVDMSVCDKLFKKEVFDGVSFPEGYLSEDMLVFRNIASKIDKAVLTGIPFYHYRQRECSITKSFNIKYFDTYETLKKERENGLNIDVGDEIDWIFFELNFLCHIFYLCQIYKHDKETSKFLAQELQNRKRDYLTDKMPVSLRFKYIILRLHMGKIIRLLKNVRNKMS
jgi:glycosyltransferase involved in cell wall biosynthesis